MKKYKRLWIIAGLSIITIFALVRLGNIKISLETLSQVNWTWYLLVIVSYYASVVARGWRWQTILKAMGWPVGFVYASTLLMAGLFLSAILPARAGDLARVVMLRQDHKIPVSQGIASLASERALDVFAILILAVIGAWLALSGHMPPEVLQLMVVMAVLFTIGIAGLLVIPGIESWLRELKLVRKILPDKFWSIYQKVLDFGFSLIQGVRILLKKPAALVVVVGQSFFVWLWDALMVYFVLLSLGIVEPFSVSLFTAMISDLVTAVPLTPGSLGQFDATMIGLLTLFGLTVTQASMAALLLRVVQLWTFIPISGIVTYIFGFSRALDLNFRDEMSADQPATLSTSASTASNPVEG